MTEFRKGIQRAGWTQINVARDAHFYSGRAPAQVCECDYRRPQLSSQWAGVAGTVLYSGWRFLCGAVLTALMIGTSVFALSLWASARASKGLNATLEGLERILGGAPNRLISAPAKLLPLLGVAHELADLDNVKRLEPDYDHTH